MNRAAIPQRRSKNQPGSSITFYSEEMGQKVLREMQIYFMRLCLWKNMTVCCARGLLMPLLSKQEIYDSIYEVVIRESHGRSGIRIGLCI